MKKITLVDYNLVMGLLLEKKTIKEISQTTGICRKTIGLWKKGKPFGKNVSNFRILLNSKSKEELQKLFDSSTSITDILKTLGQISTCSFYRNVLKEFIKKYDIDSTLMKYNHTTRPKKSKIQFTINSNSCRGHIKRYLIQNGILKNECSECGMKDFYNNKPVSMELDHINGINNDNRLVNLRLLCPVCHSQQPTHRGKNVKIKPIKLTQNSYCSCGNIKYHTSNLCYVCTTNNRPKKFDPPKEELEQLVKEKPMTQIGKMYGVSDNAVKQRCKKLGIELKPMRGHWMKKKYNKE